MGQILHGSATIPLTGRRMQAFAERGAHYPNCNTAIDGFDRGIEPNLWFESEDRREVAQARRCPRFCDGAEGVPLNRSQPGRGSPSGGLPPVHASAT